MSFFASSTFTVVHVVLSFIGIAASIRSQPSPPSPPAKTRGS